MKLVSPIWGKKLQWYAQRVGTFIVELIHKSSSMHMANHVIGFPSTFIEICLSEDEFGENLKIVNIIINPFFPRGKWGH